MPVAGARISCVILYVSISTKGSPMLTGLANALEPPPDRQPRDACNLRHSYFCPHYSLIFPFAFSLPHFDFGGNVAPAQFCGTACNDIE